MSDKAIVFDFDGVLAKSMEQHAEAYRRTLAPLGVMVSDGDVFIREGARSETIIADLLASAGVRVSEARVRELADEKQDVFRSLGEPGLYEGARGLVEAVSRPGVRLGLVTGTRRENVDRLIPELVGRFRAVVAQEDYSCDKPDPEPYVRATQKLGVESGSCAALENAVRGVESARAAGYGFVLGITTTLDAGVLSSARPSRIVATHMQAADALMDWAGLV